MRSFKHFSTIGALFLPLLILFLITRYYAGPGQTPTAPSSALHVRDTTVANDAIFAFSNITRRQDYTCGPGRPCSNGACCGASGNCGYGDKYCGDGCTSNCDAMAECGKHARPSGKRCPLNTCCSQYGFCGTTEVRWDKPMDLYVGCPN